VLQIWLWIRSRFNWFNGFGSRKNKNGSTKRKNLNFSFHEELDVLSGGLNAEVQISCMDVAS
jgi:hypothetical protein